MEDGDGGEGGHMAQRSTEREKQQGSCGAAVLCPVQGVCRWLGHCGGHAGGS